MNVQKKNLLRVLKYVTEQIELQESDRIEAEDVTTNWNGPHLCKIDIPIGNSGCFRLELTYPNQEDD